MALDKRFLPFVPSGHLKVWVLVPHVLTCNQDINYYYDFKESYKEFETCFQTLNISWVWLAITNKNYKEKISKIKREKEDGVCFPVVFNMCDGDDINDVPGLNIIQYLNELQLVYTGADTYFYNITTSKIKMKSCFDEHQVCTSFWKVLLDSNLQQVFDSITKPIIIKPSVSAGSLGIGVQNVVNSFDEFKKIYLKLKKSNTSEWKLNHGGFLAESFIKGCEFTTFIVGSYSFPKLAKIYTPVERIFHASLPEEEKFLSYERLWEIYENESSMPNQEDFFQYHLPPPELIEEIKSLSWQAFCALKGMGYARVDLRYDTQTKTCYVLEVNAQCGLSEDENFTSIGAILKYCNLGFDDLVIDIINDAFARRTIKF